MSPTRIRFDVYFLGTDGMWRLQHTFKNGTYEENEANAIACADNLARTVTATVNEVEFCRWTGRITSEVQVYEAKAKGAA